MRIRRLLWLYALAAFHGGLMSGLAATFTVNVVGNSFSPPAITINPGDTIVWPNVGSFHTVTGDSASDPFCGGSPPPNGACTVTFPTTGSFRYHCVFHAVTFNMTGVVTVASAAVPPTVSITNPPNNTLLTAPATVPVNVSASDADGSVVSVQLLTNGVTAATSTNFPFNFTLNSLPAGNYTLRARALDNQSLSTVSGPVNLRIASKPLLVFDRGTNGSIQFQFNSASGVDYVVERAAPLTNFSPVVTNPGSGGLIQFSETNGGAGQHTYRVRLQ